jgi:two-component system NtrC family sensor kinase
MATVVETAVPYETLERALAREKLIRRQAEQLLEDKARELYETNLTLQQQYASLQEAQAQLVQSEKMASLGVLAAGVAHEINNPIGFVMSNLNTLADYVRIFTTLCDEYRGWQQATITGDTANAAKIGARIEQVRKREKPEMIAADVDQLLAESSEGLHRVKDIVQNLRTFARLDEADVREVDLNEGIEATLKMVWNELKYKCQLHKRLEPLPMLRCYAGQLNQVVMNLLVNAAQAIPDRGEITVETYATDDDIFIKVSDTGHGIPAENIPKLFQPFFTTKPIGKGTGLGLSIAYGIVEKHRGEIAVESQVGVGSTFIIRLPCAGVTS